MPSISNALDALLNAATSSASTNCAAKDSLQTIKSSLNLLDLSKPSNQMIEKICSVLREPLIPLYIAFPQLTLDLCSSIISVICDKISRLKAGDALEISLWQGAYRALLSGVLDLLEERRTAKVKDNIARALYPVLCMSLATKETRKPTTQAEINLLSTICLLLSESATGHTNNQRKLRNNSLLGGEQLGALISQTRDFLALESLLNLLATLLPITNNTAAGRANRLAFVKSIFESGSPPHFACGSELTAIMQSVSVRDWEVTSAKIVDVLARHDISSPQPFKVPHITACGTTFAQSNAVDRLYLDTRSFFTNVDEGDACETFQALYTHVSDITIVGATDATTNHVTVHLSHPPIIGISVMKWTSGEDVLLEFDIQTSDMNRFLKAAKARRLTMKNPVKLMPMKTSLCESTSLDFDLQGNPIPEPSAQERIETIGRIFDETQTEGFFASDASGLAMGDAVADIVLESAPGVAQVTTIDPRKICQPMRTPSKDKAFATVPIKSPLYESVFGSSDDELSDLSDNDLPNKDIKSFTTGCKAETTKGTSKVARRARARRIVDSDVESFKETAILKCPEVDEMSAIKCKVLSKAEGIEETSAPAPGPKEKEPSRKPAVGASRKSAQKQSEAEQLAKTPHAAVANGPKASSPLRLVGRNAKKPISSPKRPRPAEHDQDDESKQATKKRRGNTENKTTPARTLSARTAALLKSPKKPALAAKQYRYKGRTSSPAPEDSPVPAVDFDALPQLTIVKAVPKTQRKQVSNMKTRTGEKTRRKNADRGTAKEKIPAEKAKVAQGSRTDTTKAKRARAIVQGGKDIVEIQKPQAHNEEEVSMKAKIDEAGKKASKPQKAPWQESGFLKNLSNAVGQTNPCTVTETPVTPEAETLFMDFEDNSLPAAPTSEDVYDHRVAASTPPVIDLTDDSVVQSVSPLVDVTLGKEEKPSRRILAEDIQRRWKEGVDETQSAESTQAPVLHQPPLRPKPTKVIQTPPVQLQNAILPKDVGMKPAVIPAASHIPSKPNVRFGSPSPRNASRALPQRRHSPQELLSVFYEQRGSPVAPRSGGVSRISRQVEKSQNVSHVESLGSCIAMDAIVNTLNEIHEAVIRRVCERFDGVTKEVREGRDMILHEAAADLERMRVESVVHFNNVVNLEEEYCEARRKIAVGCDAIKQTGEVLGVRVQEIIRDHDKASLCKKFPTSLFARSAGIRM